jgi:hypothetical protein
LCERLKRQIDAENPPAFESVNDANTKADAMHPSPDMEEWMDAPLGPLKQVKVVYGQCTVHTHLPLPEYPTPRNDAGEAVSAAAAKRLADSQREVQRLRDLVAEMEAYDGQAGSYVWRAGPLEADVERLREENAKLRGVLNRALPYVASVRRFPPAPDRDDMLDEIRKAMEEVPEGPQTKGGV